jgi:predicted acetyltransferase
MLSMMFEFKNIDLLSDYEIDLRIKAKIPANTEKGYVPAYKYNIFLHNTNTNVGFIDIRIGYTESLYYGGHIGYTVFEQFRGNNYALKACRLIKQVASAHEMKKLYITCNPNNIPSRRTCEKLGLKLIEIAKLPPYNDMYLEGEREVCIFEWEFANKEV